MKAQIEDKKAEKSIVVVEDAPQEDQTETEETGQIVSIAQQSEEVLDDVKSVRSDQFRST